MPDNIDYYVVQARKSVDKPWLIYAKPERLVSGYFPVAFYGKVSDTEILMYTLDAARELVKYFMQHSAAYGDWIFRIRPWECSLDDPRIEEFNNPDEDFVPMVVVEVSGGIVSDVWTNLPYLLLTVLDHDAAEEGNVCTDTYTLKPKSGSVSQEALRNLIDDFLGVEHD